MSRSSATIVCLAWTLAIAGCSTTHSTTRVESQVRAADIDALTGPPWIGTLTYLDYTTRRHTTIDSSLIVRRRGDSPPSWEFGMGYSKEPHADSTEIILLSTDGRLFGDEQVRSREVLQESGVRFVTECDGEDDHRQASFRFEHTITAHEYSRRKLVRLKDESEFFERHVYRWTR